MVLEKTDAFPGEQKAADRSDARDQHSLGEELADQPAAAGPDGGPDGKLASPLAGAAKKHAGDVYAGERQDEQGHREHEVEDGLGAAAGVGKGELLHAHPAVTLVCLRPHYRQARGQHVELRARLIPGDAGLQLAHHFHAVDKPQARIPGRGPQVRPELLRDRECEARGHHADNRAGLAVDIQRLAEHARVRAKFLLPKRVGEDHQEGPARAVLLGGEPAAEHRLHAQHVEQVRAAERPRMIGGHAAQAAEIEAEPVNACKRLEDGLPLPQHEVVAVGNPIAMSLGRSAAGPRARRASGAALRRSEARAAGCRRSG